MKWVHFKCCRDGLGLLTSITVVPMDTVTSSCSLAFPPDCSPPPSISPPRVGPPSPRTGQPCCWMHTLGCESHVSLWGGGWSPGPVHIQGGRHPASCPLLSPLGPAQLGTRLACLSTLCGGALTVHLHPCCRGGAHLSLGACFLVTVAVARPGWARAQPCEWEVVEAEALWALSPACSRSVLLLISGADLPCWGELACQALISGGQGQGALAGVWVT